MTKIQTKVYQRLTVDKLSTEGCINLLEAFVRNLSDDFKEAYWQYLDNKKSKDRVEHYNHLRKIFLSKYFSELTELDGQEILSRLEGDISKRYYWRMKNVEVS